MPKCTSTVKHTLVKVEENKRKAVFRNKKKDPFDVTTVDGCQITDGERTDYLVTKQKVASVLVELKGGGVQKACDQLFTTVSHPNMTGLFESKVGFLVICSKYPRFDSFVAKAKVRAAKEYKAGFHVVCDSREFDIERVVAIDGPY